LDEIGLVNRITYATANIDAGRKGFAAKGKAEEGRVLYEVGIAAAMTTFQQIQTAADPQIIILAEYTFITQEFELCDKSDKDTIDSLTKAMSKF